MLGAAIAALNDTLCESTGDALARQLFHLGRSGHRIWSLVDIPGTLADAERHLELSTLQPLATRSYDRSWGAFHKAYALCMLGRGVEALKLTQVQVEEVRSRGDLTVLPAWVWIESCVLPAVGELERAERDLAAIRSTWCAQDVTAQSVLILAAEYMLAMYRGEPERTWEATRVHRERLERSLSSSTGTGSRSEPALEPRSSSSSTSARTRPVPSRSCMPTASSSRRMRIRRLNRGEFRAQRAPSRTEPCARTYSPSSMSYPRRRRGELGSRVRHSAAADAHLRGRGATYILPRRGARAACQRGGGVAADASTRGVPRQAAVPPRTAGRRAETSPLAR